MKIYPLALAFLCFIAKANAKSLDFDYSIGLSNFYGYTDYSHSSFSSYKHNNLNSSLNTYINLSYELNSNYKASLIGYTMIDTAKEIENYNQGYWGEEFFVELQSPMGQLSVGQDRNVAYIFAVGAPNVGSFKLNNTDLTNFLINPNWYQKGSKSSYKTLNSTYINTDGASFKLNYITPEFYNTKLGITYVPKNNSRAGLVSKASSSYDKQAYILGLYNSFYLKDYEIETSLGYGYYEDNDEEYSLGISIYRKGWTLGASYRKTNAKTKYNKIDEITLFDAYREAQAYNVGISYEIGPFTTGVSYFNSKSDTSSNKDELIGFSNSFELNKYTTLSLTLAHQKSTDIETIKGYATILGLEFALWKKYA